MSRIWINLVSCLGGGSVGGTAVIIAEDRRWPLAVGLLAAFFIALWLFYLWYCSLGHIKAHYLRQDRRAAKRGTS